MEFGAAHMPGGAFYDETQINPSEGDRWFCTEVEAKANGFRKSQRQMEAQS
jgi:hypothetical protein